MTSKNIEQTQTAFPTRARREARGAAPAFFWDPPWRKSWHKTHPAGCASERTPPPLRRAPRSRLTGRG